MPARLPRDRAAGWRRRLPGARRASIRSCVPARRSRSARMRATPSGSRRRADQHRVAGRRDDELVQRKVVLEQAPCRVAWTSPCPIGGLDGHDLRGRCARRSQTRGVGLDDHPHVEQVHEERGIGRGDRQPAQHVRSSTFHSGRSFTVVPRRVRPSTRPFWASARKPSRREGRLMPSCVDSSASVGSSLPGASSPDTIWKPSRSTTCADLRARTRRRRASASSAFRVATILGLRPGYMGARINMSDTMPLKSDINKYTGGPLVPPAGYRHPRAPIATNRPGAFDDRRSHEQGCPYHGASTGIGAAAALAFARQGSKLVVHYNASRDAAEGVARDIKALAARCCSSAAT